MTFVHLIETSEEDDNDLVKVVSDEDIEIVWKEILNLCIRKRKTLNGAQGCSLVLEVKNIFKDDNKYINELIDKIYTQEKIRKLIFESKLD